MRNEFSKKTKLNAFDRAKGLCEKCAARLFVGKYHYDHVIPDWLGGENTLENCEVLCVGCHLIKTKGDQRDIAKSRRVRARHLGAAASARPMPCGKRSPWKKKLNGEIVRREQVS